MGLLPQMNAAYMSTLSSNRGFAVPYTGHNFKKIPSAVKAARNIRGRFKFYSNCQRFLQIIMWIVPFLQSHFMG
jgi:hypothetical protein